MLDEGEDDDVVFRNKIPQMMMMGSKIQVESKIPLERHEHREHGSQFG